jgi:hypothetical protein
MILLPDKGTNLFFHLESRQKQYSAAAETLQPKIHSGAKDQKTVAAAGVAFFHFDDVFDADVHSSTSFLLPLYRKSRILQVKPKKSRI